MIAILGKLQERYVPQSDITLDGRHTTEVVHAISVGGDQLTEERAINVQKAMLDGDTVLEKLGGLQPKFEDWHLKLTLYEVQ